MLKLEIAQTPTQTQQCSICGIAVYQYMHGAYVPADSQYILTKLCAIFLVLLARLSRWLSVGQSTDLAQTEISQHFHELVNLQCF